MPQWLVLLSSLCPVSGAIGSNLLISSSIQVSLQNWRQPDLRGDWGFEVSRDTLQLLRFPE